MAGRHLPLFYLLVATLVAAPHNKAVVIIDLEGRFDVTRVISCTPYTAPAAGRNADSSDANGQDTRIPQAASHPAQGDEKDHLKVHDEASLGGAPDSTTTAAQGTTHASGRPTRPYVVTLADLQHLYVYRPARGSRSHVRDIIASAEQYMLYGTHRSRDREWWGTIVVGAAGATPFRGSTGPMVDVAAAWKGWLRVDRAEVPGFGLGLSAEESLADRGRRQAAVDAAGWAASSLWGGFAFDERG